MKAIYPVLLTGPIMQTVKIGHQAMAQDVSEKSNVLLPQFPSSVAFSSFSIVQTTPTILCSQYQLAEFVSEGNGGV